MRASFFGPEASTAHVTERLLAAAPRVPQRSTSTSATRRRSTGSSPTHGEEIELVIHTAAQPSHDWAASDPQTDFGVNANGTLNLLEATRATLPRRDRSSSARPTRSTATRPNRLPLEELETRLELPEDHRYFERDRHDDVDRLLDPLAVRRLEGRRRPAGPGVRPLLRDADGLLPRRLPDRAPARRRTAARVPRLPDEVHRDRRRRTPSSATRASRCATTSTAPTWSRAFAAFHARSARRRRLQHRRRPRQQLLDARGDRALRADRRPRARAGSWARSRGSATTAGGSPTWRRSKPTTRTGSSRYGVEDILEEIHEQNAERWTVAAA